MSRARYLVAKYIPNEFRNEPRNVGVVVWSESGTDARFLNANRDGDLFGRLPSFILSRPAYKQWVQFWMSQIKKPELQFLGLSKTVPSKSKEFIQALVTFNSSNFILHEAGEVAEEVSEKDLHDVADYLFSVLVLQDLEAEEEIAKESAGSMLTVKHAFEKIVDQCGK